MVILVVWLVSCELIARKREVSLSPTSDLMTVFTVHGQEHVVCINQHVKDVLHLTM